MSPFSRREFLAISGVAAGVAVAPRGATKPKPAGRAVSLGSVGRVEYSLVPTAGGLTLSISRSGTVRWQAAEGPVELHVCTASAASGASHACYSSAQRRGSQTVAHASIRSSGGSVVDIIDTYSTDSRGLHLRRQTSVREVGAGETGYATGLVVRSAQTCDPLSLQWFAPGSWYGNDADNFTSRSKLVYTGGEVAFAVD
ncbi:MAG: hypothetical protein ACR2KJ_03475 [Jatrophihabitans sp.]